MKSLFYIIFFTILIKPKDILCQTCTITYYDATIIRQAQENCRDIIIDSIEVPAGESLDLTHMQDGTKLTFRGTITWGYQEWTGPLVKTKGNNIEITGESGHILDGRGALWWDGQGGNGGKIKPKFFSLNLVNSEVHGLNVKNTPVQAFSVASCNGILIRDIVFDNSEGDVTNGGHNTDAFNVNSDNVIIRNATVYNQDDCIAINSGYNITFENNYCSGGHGISIGSVGGRSNNEVRLVRVKNCHIVNSDNGVRIKTILDATGSVSDIVYEDVSLNKIHKYGITIQGDYPDNNGKPTGGVPITNLIMKNISGLVEKNGQNIYIVVENASDWHFSDITVSGGSKNKACLGIPSGAGVSC